MSIIAASRLRADPVVINRNVVLGGIGSQINTLAKIATYMGTSESNIKLFAIDSDNNVSFSVLGTYDNLETLGEYEILSFYYEFEGKVIHKNSVTPSIQSTFKRVILNSEITFGNQDFRLKELEYAILPNAISGANGTFGQQRGYLKRVYLPRWIEDSGSLGGDYSDIAKNAIWYFNKSLETSNNGGINSSIQFTVLDQGGNAEARFIQNLDKPNTVSDLSVSNITSNSVQLDFTPPAVNTNANDFYYVYIDYLGISFEFKYSTRHEISAFFKEITSSGDTLTGLPSNKDISIQIQTVDYYHNVSNYSNIVTFTTS
jgi:hypothetical protein